MESGFGGSVSFLRASSWRVLVAFECGVAEEFPEDLLEEADGATRVTIELRQTLTGFLPRLGSYMVRRAAVATIEEALDGLERISG